MKKYHTIEKATVEDGVLHLHVDGKEVRKSLAELSSAFREASLLELETFEITPSGYGLHWPLLDEDISVDGLLGVVHSREDTCQTV